MLVAIYAGRVDLLRGLSRARGAAVARRRGQADQLSAGPRWSARRATAPPADVRSRHRHAAASRTTPNEARQPVDAQGDDIANLATALAVVAAIVASASIAARAEEIGSVDTEFKLIGPDHKVVVEAFDDRRSRASRATCRARRPAASRARSASRRIRRASRSRAARSVRSASRSRCRETSRCSAKGHRWCGSTFASCASSTRSATRSSI